MPETNFPKGVVLLSSYPQPKLIVECSKCGMRAKYDKLELLETGGDRPLPNLKDDIASRHGCTKLHNIDMYDRCAARYANLI
jgi:hypothetical protein